MTLEQVQRKFFTKKGSARCLFQNCNLLILFCLYNLGTNRPVTTNKILVYMPKGHTKGWAELNKHLIDLENLGMITKMPHIKPDHWFIDEGGKKIVQNILTDEDTKYTLKIYGIDLKVIDFYNNHFCNILNRFSGISTTATV